MNIEYLEPQPIWKNFSALNAIPRPSKKEGKVITFIKDFGESLGLETIVDETGNVLIRKPATPGMENRKEIILQAHLDMVHQKNNDTIFDFETQGIKMYVEDDWVKAEGTTLGADNGIGVAAIMSILESNDIPHPDLEALFTYDEETGMTGAFKLKPGFLTGDILLNLDTEEDEEIDIGCAGGIDVTAAKDYKTVTPDGQSISIEIKGLQGGHSGMDIDKGRGNANVLLARLLFAGIPYDIQLCKIDAGGLRNAIPREARAQVTVKNREDFLENIKDLKADILAEYRSIEKTLTIDLANIEIQDQGLSVQDSTLFIKALNAAHNGVFRLSPDVKGLVEASNNIARVILDNGRIRVLCLTRSSVESTKMAVAHQLKSCFELAGMEVTFSGSYPGWQPNPDATITSVLVNIYKEKFGKAPKVIACHAGLECGIIGSHYPKMEMISFGPTIKGAHSPEERVSISSVKKFWDYLKDILKQIPKQ